MARIIRSGPGTILAALLAAGLLAACGGAPEGFTLHGARVEVDSSAPFARNADFPDRLESTIGAALAYWGGTWADLDGATIALTDDPYVACGGNPAALGCWDGNVRVTTRDPGVGTLSCVEETTLVHEIGHAVVGDLAHTDPRWMGFDPVAAELAGRPGYATSGEVACPLWPSVWRHPLGTP